MNAILKKDVIINTATSLFSAHGYHAVGVDRIVEDSKIAKMTLYKYFPSKEILIEQVLLNRDHNLRDSITNAISKKKSSIRKLKAIFEWYDDWFNSADFHGCMFIKASEEYSDATSVIRSISKAHKVWLQQVIKSILDDMKFKTPDAFASHILIILDGLTVSCNMMGKNNQVKEAWSCIEALLPDNK